MVLKPLDKTVLKRLRSVMKREQQRTGRKFPKRALRAFGNLRNIDERKLREWGHVPGVIVSAGKKDKGPGYGVRLLHLKGEEGVVLKFPTLASKHYKVTPQEEIRFVRRMVDAINPRSPNAGFTIIKPIGHPVGPFIAMRYSNFPTIGDFYHSDLNPKANRMLTRLSNEMNLPKDKLKEKLLGIGSEIALQSFDVLREGKVVLSKNYPASDWIKNKNGTSFALKPLDTDHLQIIGQKNGVIQLVPYIDAI